MITAKTSAIITLSAVMLILAALACTTPEPAPAPIPTATALPARALAASPTDTPPPTPTAAPTDTPLTTPTAAPTLPPTATAAPPTPTSPPTPAFTPLPKSTATPPPTPTRTPTPPSPITKLEDGARLERSQPAQAAQLLQLPWVADGVDDTEREAAEELIRAARWDPGMFDALMAMPWMKDSLTIDESHAIRGIRGSAYHSPLLTERMMQKSWVQDDITEAEGNTLKYLRYISGRNADAATALVAMPFLDSVEDRDMLALRSLNNIAARDASDFRELMAHPTIEDGITDEETKIVAVLGGRTHSYAPGAAEVLLTGTDVYIQERLIQLPHTGETLLAVIGVQDPDPRSIDYFEHAVRSIERFMGEPYPINYLALLYYDNLSNNANNNFTHLLFMGEEDTVNREWHAGVIAHEIAHWYWSGDGDEGYQYRKWITEGNPELLRVISEHERVGRPLEPVGGTCSFFDSISEMEKANPSREFIPGKATPRDCYYSLGNRFFLDLYLALGDETFRSAFNALYHRYRQDSFTDGCGMPSLNICRVESVFKDGASPEVAAKVDAVIAHWYYGKTVTHEEDQAELVALYHEMGGPNWADKTNWLSDAHIKEWYGVTTDSAGRVIELNLSDNRLSGQLPSGLGNLAKLRRLDLNDNQLTGEIPASLGNLTDLTNLGLRSNRLSGAIPSELGNLTNLTGLGLGGNQLSGAIPPELGNLTKLSSLSLSGNKKLSGPIPTWLGSLSQLKGLFLWGNQFTGTIPSELGNLTNLTWLSLSNNELSGAIPPSLGGLSNLKELYLDYNQITGDIPAQLGNLTKLTELRLRGNELTGCIPAALLAVADNDLNRLGLSTCP